MFGEGNSKKAKYVEGRSTWDRVSSRNINENLKYYYCPRMLRSSFYNSPKWDINTVERHTVFVSQGNYPIKGIHFVFEAIAVLKKKYPDITLVVTGNDMFNIKSKLDKYMMPRYIRYLYDLANELDIMHHIRWVGYKTADEMSEMLRKKKVAVIPSSIENAPNSLAEAMLIGTPCVASFVGGNMDMLEHNAQGYLYCYNEPNMLAEYIDRIFTSDELAMYFLHNAIDASYSRHEPEKLVKTIINIYRNRL